MTTPKCQHANDPRSLKTGHPKAAHPKKSVQHGTQCPCSKMSEGQQRVTSQKKASKTARVAYPSNGCTEVPASVQAQVAAQIALELHAQTRCQKTSPTGRAPPANPTTSVRTHNEHHKDHIEPLHGEEGYPHHGRPKQTESVTDLPVVHQQQPVNPRQAYPVFSVAKAARRPPIKSSSVQTENDLITTLMQQYRQPPPAPTTAMPSMYTNTAACNLRDMLQVVDLPPLPPDIADERLAFLRQQAAEVFARVQSLLQTSAQCGTEPGLADSHGTTGPLPEMVTHVTSMVLPAMGSGREAASSSGCVAGQGAMAQPEARATGTCPPASADPFRKLEEGVAKLLHPSVSRRSSLAAAGDDPYARLQALVQELRAFSPPSSAASVELHPPPTPPPPSQSRPPAYMVPLHPQDYLLSTHMQHMAQPSGGPMSSPCPASRGSPDNRVVSPHSVMSTSSTWSVSTEEIERRLAHLRAQVEHEQHRQRQLEEERRAQSDPMNPGQLHMMLDQVQSHIRSQQQELEVLGAEVMRLYPVEGQHGPCEKTAAGTRPSEPPMSETEQHGGGADPAFASLAIPSSTAHQTAEETLDFHRHPHRQSLEHQHQPLDTTHMEHHPDDSAHGSSRTRTNSTDRSLDRVSSGIQSSNFRSVTDTTEDNTPRSPVQHSPEDDLRSSRSSTRQWRIALADRPASASALNLLAHHLSRHESRSKSASARSSRTSRSRSRPRPSMKDASTDPPTPSLATVPPIRGFPTGPPSTDVMLHGHQVMEVPPQGPHANGSLRPSVPSCDELDLPNKDNTMPEALAAREDLVESTTLESLVNEDNRKAVENSVQLGMEVTEEPSALEPSEQPSPLHGPPEHSPSSSPHSADGDGWSIDCDAHAIELMAGKGVISVNSEPSTMTTQTAAFPGGAISGLSQSSDPAAGPLHPRRLDLDFSPSLADRGVESANTSTLQGLESRGPLAAGMNSILAAQQQQQHQDFSSVEAADYSSISGHEKTSSLGHGVPPGLNASDLQSFDHTDATDAKQASPKAGDDDDAATTSSSARSLLRLTDESIQPNATGDVPIEETEDEQDQFASTSNLTHAIQEGSSACPQADLSGGHGSHTPAQVLYQPAFDDDDFLHETSSEESGPQLGEHLAAPKLLRSDEIFAAVPVGAVQQPAHSAADLSHRDRAIIQQLSRHIVLFVVRHSDTAPMLVNMLEKWLAARGPITYEGAMYLEVSDEGDHDEGSKMGNSNNYGSDFEEDQLAVDDGDRLQRSESNSELDEGQAPSPSFLSVSPLGGVPAATAGQPSALAKDQPVTAPHSLSPSVTAQVTHGSSADTIVVPATAPGQTAICISPPPPSPEPSSSKGVHPVSPTAVLSPRAAVSLAQRRALAIPGDDGAIVVPSLSPSNLNNSLTSPLLPSPQQFSSSFASSSASPDSPPTPTSASSMVEEESTEPMLTAADIRQSLSGPEGRKLEAQATELFISFIFDVLKHWGETGVLRVTPNQPIVLPDDLLPAVEANIREKIRNSNSVMAAFYTQCFTLVDKHLVLDAVKEAIQQYSDAQLAASSAAEQRRRSLLKQEESRPRRLSVVAVAISALAELEKFVRTRISEWMDHTPAPELDWQTIARWSPMNWKRDLDDEMSSAVDDVCSSLFDALLVDTALAFSGLKCT